MNEGWVKLHRKSKDNLILRDHLAWTLFTWILMEVDRKTGKCTIGRFILANILGSKPTTLYKALKRLEKKHKVVTLTSNNKFTEIRVLNWAKYQQDINTVTQSGNNKVTTKGQQSNTIQELRIKNKEVSRAKSSCPLKDHKLCISFLDKLAKQKNLPHGWINFPKQLSFLHKLLRLKYTFTQIQEEADLLDKNNFMWDKWDLSTIASQLEKKGREVIIHAKNK